MEGIQQLELELKNNHRKQPIPRKRRWNSKKKTTKTILLPLKTAVPKNFF